MGGFTTVMDMPNTDPPVDDDEHFQMKKATAILTAGIMAMGVITSRGYRFFAEENRGENLQRNL